jgi:hypothetical protein
MCENGRGDHPTTLNIRYNMVRVQFELSNYAESKKIFKSVYESQKIILGEKHPDTMNTNVWIDLALRRADHSTT